MRQEQIDRYKKLLTKLGNGEIDVDSDDFELGICSQIHYEDEILNLMAKWPKASGNVGYPVPATTERCPHHQYSKTVNKPKLMWLEGEYAALRRELCLWLADNLDSLKEESL